MISTLLLQAHKMLWYKVAKAVYVYTVLLICNDVNHRSCFLLEPCFFSGNNFNGDTLQFSSREQC